MIATNKSTAKRTMFLALAAAFFLASVPGCAKKNPNMPKTRPFRVEVRNGSEPAANLKVTLFSPDSDGKWVVSGRTDEKGVAVLTTVCGASISKGSPEGDFKVLLADSLQLKQPERFSERKAREATDEERKKLGYRTREEYFAALDEARTIPKEFADPKTTPFSISIRKGDKRAVVDLAEAVEAAE